MALYGMNYLRRKLDQKRVRVKTRYEYYELKNKVPDFGISTPDNAQLRAFTSCLGWCAKAVDVLADRLVFRGFSNDGFDMETIYRMNNGDVLFDSAILSSLVTACSFLFLSRGDDGYPRIQAIDGGNATGIMDPLTQMQTEGYAVLERDQRGNALREAYFIPGKTYYYKAGQLTSIETTPAPFALLVPVVYRPDPRRPFGHARISRACMSIMQSAARTIKRSEISAEFFSYPQRYVVGTDPDRYDDDDEEEGEGSGAGKAAKALEPWKMAMSAMLEISRGEDGEIPKLGEFQQQSMAPHLEQLRTFAALFAGETGMTLDDLGFPSENPASAEAIKASHENLRLMAEKAQRSFGVSFLNAGYLAACIRDGVPYLRRQVAATIPKWEPAFRPDAAALSSIGDGAIKINQAVPGYIGAGNLQDLTGIPAEA